MRAQTGKVLQLLFEVNDRSVLDAPRQIVDSYAAGRR